VPAKRDVEQIQQKTTTWPWCGRFSVLVFFFVSSFLLRCCFFWSNYYILSSSSSLSSSVSCRLSSPFSFPSDTAAVVTAAAAAAGAAPVSVPRSSLPPAGAVASFSGGSSREIQMTGKTCPYLGRDEKLGFMLSPDSVEHPLRGMTRHRTRC
jgi:hypothetical protein